MKYLILFLLLLPLSLIGQVESQFNGTLNVFSASRIGFTNTFTISGIFSSTTTSYTSANSAIGDIVQVQSGSRFYWMHIYSIASNSGGVITCNVRDSSSTLTTFPSGKWSIFRPTTNLRLPLSPDGETNASRSATFNTLALKVDEIQTSVASATNCEITLTKNNHGFRKWTPLYWTGSTFVRPTYDTLVPDYIVVDSLTANTFVVATCGTYATTLADGIYWYTNQSPGYSLTQDTTKAPLFQVIDSTLILNPIVGFNLMSGGGGTADGNGIYSGSDSLSQTNTYAAMAADGSQSFGLGYWPSFPDRDYDYDNEYGLYVSPVNGEVSLAGKHSYLSFYDDTFYAAMSRPTVSQAELVRIFADGSNATAYFDARNYSGNHSSTIGVDSVSAFISDGINTGNKIRFPYVSDPNGKPSITSGVTNILKWTAGVPSFGYRYETDTTYSDVLIKTGDNSVSIGNFSTFPDYTNGDIGLFVNPDYYGEVSLVNSKGSNSFVLVGSTASTASILSTDYPGLRYGGVDANKGAVSITTRGLSTTDKYWKVTIDSIKFEITRNIASVNYSYNLLPANAVPSTISGAITTLTNTGNGSISTPSFLRSQHGVATGTTDGSGDLTVTFAAAMPDATYSLLATVEGTTSYTISVHTKATGTCKVRFFNPTTGTAVTATSVTISYEAKDY